MVCLWKEKVHPIELQQGRVQKRNTVRRSEQVTKMRVNQSHLIANMYSERIYLAVHAAYKDQSHHSVHQVQHKPHALPDRKTLAEQQQS